MSEQPRHEAVTGGAPTAAPGPPVAPGPMSSEPQATLPTTPGRFPASADDGGAPVPASIDGPGVSGPTGTAQDQVAEAPPLKAARTRTSATYIAVGVGLLVLVLVIIFVAQNESKSSVHFLTFHFKLALGLIVLASTVAGGLVVLMISLARVLQLRLMARRHRKAHDRS